MKKTEDAAASSFLRVSSFGVSDHCVVGHGGFGDQLLLHHIEAVMPVQTHIAFLIGFQIGDHL